MDSIAIAALRSWILDPRTLILLVVSALTYYRGWRRLTRVLPQHFTGTHLALFLSGLALLFVALDSPLDAFSSLLLQAHMVQHLLLMMVIPPLLLLGRPMLPLLRGLPQPFVKEGLGPFLRWSALRRFAGLLTRPWFAWLAYNLAAVVWHIPALYEMALRSPAWHDVEHACFFWTAVLFWWPVVQPWPSRSRSARWFVIPYLLAADLVNTAIAASFVFADKVLYPSYAMAPLAGVDPRNDQIAAGLIMWIPGSIFYLVPGTVLAMVLINGSRNTRKSRRRPDAIPASREGIIARFLRWKHARLSMQLIFFGAAAAVVIDGFLGPQMAPMNLAGVLPWIHWRALVVLALLFCGNLFCMACPFMLPRTAARRWFHPLTRWPSWLRSKWLAASLFVLYLWAYEALSLWDSPRATAWIVIGYFLAAFFVDAIFRGASFCKYVCPLGQFNFVHSLISPTSIRVKKQSICRTCTTYDCIRGNQTHRGCELYLFQPKKGSNLDCTFCLDCVQACPHQNVNLLPVIPGQMIPVDTYHSSLGRLSRRWDIAALVMVVVCGAFANAAAMIAPFADASARFASLISRPVLVAILIGLVTVALPAVAVWLCQISTKQLSKTSAGASFVFTLIPVGAAMWAAHLLYHFALGIFTIVPVVQRIAGLIPDWTIASMAIVPNWLLPTQVLLLDSGLLAALLLIWQTAKRRSKDGLAFRMFFPWGCFASVLYGLGLWILFEPMQMRGMMMS